jgi:hypothetical protein
MTIYAKSREKLVLIVRGVERKKLKEDYDKSKTTGNVKKDDDVSGTSTFRFA